MARIRYDFRSTVLSKDSGINLILPDDCTEDTPVVYLLHGLNGCENDWLRNTSIERYAKKRKMAMIMPFGGKSFFCDMKYGEAYYSFLADEVCPLMRRIFPITKKREKTFVAGLSMGAYGAVKLALDRSLDFAACAAFSGALDIRERFSLGDKDSLGVQIWGEDFLNVIPGSGDDLYELARRLERENRPKPWIIQACGTEDKRYHENTLFRRFIENRGYVYEYRERPGGHTWNLWDFWIQPALDFFLRCMEESSAVKSQDEE